MSEIQNLVAKAVCQEQCAVYGEPPCWRIADWPNESCSEPGCAALSTAATERIAQIIHDAFHKAQSVAEVSERMAHNSYGAGYDRGYADALGEMFEKLTDRSPALPLQDERGAT